MNSASSGLPQLGQWNSLDDVQALQEKQLPQTVSWAARSPFYRSRLNATALPATVADLAGLPLTTKQDLRDNYPFGMLAVPKERLATYHESSGTAGRPTPSYYTAEDWTDLAERFARKWIGMSERDILLVRTPYALMLSGHLAQAAGRLCGATVVPGDNRSLAMPYARVVRVLHDLEVTLTWAVATEYLLWAAAAAAVGHRPDTDFPGLRALFTGGEPLTDARRRRISRIWGVPVVEEYGSTETGSLAGECPHGRLHLWSDRALFEVYDPASGTVRADGDGQLVVTPLYREAMPLLRYNLEDDVSVSYGDCDCGWALPTVKVYGRAGFGHQVGAATVTQHQLEELVYSLPDSFGVLFWRARAEPVVLRVEIEVDHAHREAAQAQLQSSIRATFGIDSEVVGLPPGGLVPETVLTSMADVVKPRSLFGPDEDWNKALLYY
ncbi:phenylacetate--CoA ligase family protein [Actinoplanes xinjiangensis]|uniref:Phenylacetate-CoA ligase n=1 Tax=Actinoplanes xinjiangensis TaxID=512350 RepID=A0A316FEJ5_9ACTN|nr:AMP-binding protein [Actinoplanes xinjiangensis]PWK36050.1 phenylacetate-CoA ligase [Actinoplanes xinjiangensis]GIF42948.1 phenylacetate--CoA ligase [Actinoplanes xinjiangensis]